MLHITNCQLRIPRESDDQWSSDNDNARYEHDNHIFLHIVISFPDLCRYSKQAVNGI